MVDAYVLSNMQESLGLSDEQFAQAIPLVKKLQRERREYLDGARARWCARCGGCCSRAARSSRRCSSC